MRALERLALALLILVSVPSSATALAAKPAAPKLGPSVSVVLTSANLHQALSAAASVSFSTAVPHAPIIDVNEGVRYQTIKGVGGAMTDSAAWLIADKLRPGTRAWLLRHLFGRDGIDLRFIRLPIGASDFTATGTPYTYDDLPAGDTDPGLVHFSIAHDMAYIIPTLRQALSIARQPFVLATPWSAPAWMKTNSRLANPIDAMGWLRAVDVQPYAQYFVKFLKAYAAAGIHVDAITPQNEPGQLTSYPGMNLSEPSEASFITNDLAPALRAARLGTEIYGYDNNWYNVGIQYARILAGGPTKADLAGISSHCYFGVPTLLAGLHDIAPKLDEIVSECSPGNLPFSASELEIAAIRNWASAVGLWNLALDQTGGPVELPNYGCLGCTGIVTINDDTHTVTFTRGYYQLGQLSKYVAPGAVRIESNNFVSYKYFPIIGSTMTGKFATAGVDDVAFANPDGSRVLLAYNSAPSATSFAVRDDGYYFRYKLEPGTTATFVWKPAGTHTGVSNPRN